MDTRVLPLLHGNQLYHFLLLCNKLPSNWTQHPKIINMHYLTQFLKAKPLRASHPYGSDSRSFTKFRSHSHLGVHSSEDSTRMRGLCFQAQDWGWQTQFLSGCWPEVLGLHHMGLTRGLLKSQDSLLPLSERLQRESKRIQGRGHHLFIAQSH